MYSLSDTNSHNCISYQKGKGAVEEQLTISDEVAYSFLLKTSVLQRSLPHRMIFAI